MFKRYGKPVFSLKSKNIFLLSLKFTIPKPPGSLNFFPLGLVVLVLSTSPTIDLGSEFKKNKPKSKKVEPIFPRPADGELTTKDVIFSFFFKNKFFTIIFFGEKVLCVLTINLILFFFTNLKIFKQSLKLVANGFQ